MGKNEPYRFFERQQPFLVLQDQIVGIHIIGKPRILSTSPEAWIGEFFCALVDGKISVMRAINGYVIEVITISSSIEWQLTDIFSLDLPVFFLKNPGILASLIGLTVITILCHFIDKKKRQHLDALSKEHLLLFKMRSDCLTNLNPPHGHFSNITRCIARSQNMAVDKFDRIMISIYLGDDKAAILIQLV